MIAFIGARSEVAEGVIVETGAVLSMGFFLVHRPRLSIVLRVRYSWGEFLLEQLWFPAVYRASRCRMVRLAVAVVCRDSQTCGCQDPFPDFYQRAVAVTEARTFLAELLSRPSVTPDDAGCLGLIAEWLEKLGFITQPRNCATRFFGTGSSALSRRTQNSR